MDSIPNLTILGIDSKNILYRINLAPTPLENEDNKEAVEQNSDFTAGDLVYIKDNGKHIKAIYVCPSRLDGYHFCIYSDYNNLRDSQYKASTFPIERISKG